MKLSFPRDAHPPGRTLMPDSDLAASGDIILADSELLTAFFLTTLAGKSACQPGCSTSKIWHRTGASTGVGGLLTVTLYRHNQEKELYTLGQ